MLKVSNTKDAGNKYLEATKYNLDASPSTRLRELKIAGMK
jgi:hypothetical protein